MVCGEDDVLATTLAENLRFVDRFYALDGTVPNDVSRRVCTDHPKCGGYLTDADLSPASFGDKPKDGWRKAIHELAIEAGHRDDWFVLLHGDEVWTFDPAHVATAHPDADGFTFRLPLYVPRDAWDDEREPLDQLHWRLGPGWPEFRMFRGGPGVRYRAEQHFDTSPLGLRRIVHLNHQIRHYPYRAPAAQVERAARHLRTGFDPHNYRHVNESGRTLWTDAMIARHRRSKHYARLENDLA